MMRKKMGEIGSESCSLCMRKMMKTIYIKWFSRNISVVDFSTYVFMIGHSSRNMLATPSSKLSYVPKV